MNTQNKEVLELLNDFYSKLQDQESRDLFNARLNFYVDRNKDIFYTKLDKVLKSCQREYKSWLLNNYYREHPENKDKDFVIFGGAEFGKMTVRALQYLGKKIRCICDNNVVLQGTYFNGVRVESFDYIQKQCKDCIVVITTTRRRQEEVLNQLLNGGFEKSKILINHECGIWCDIPGQYFDMPTSFFGEEKEEFFIDAGCYNGQTSLDCQKMFGDRLKRIYAFEPEKSNFIKCKECLNELECEYDIFPVATWSSETILKFDSFEIAPYASRVSGNGKVEVAADSIDNLLKGRKVTYIKLDVEGSELETLKGAMDTINMYKPRLAISLYHKPEDVMQIPVFLEQLGLDYRYYIRQYQTRMAETVLYAF